MVFRGRRIGILQIECICGKISSDWNSTEGFLIRIRTRTCTNELRFERSHLEWVFDAEAAISTG